MFGYPPEEIVGKDVSILMPREYAGRNDGYLSHRFDGDEPHHLDAAREVPCLRKDGTVFPSELTVSELEDLGLYVGVHRDLTEEKSLQRDALRLGEEEQRRIGQDLHDGVGQRLTGLRYLTESFEKRLTPLLAGDPRLVQVHARLAQISEEVDRTLADVRAITRQLVPMQVASRGLTGALQELAEATDALEGVSCAFRFDDGIEVESEIATQLYRIAQEAVSNALMHGEPETVLLSLERADGELELAITDDGAGIEREAERERGIGLRTMAYRAALIG